MRIVLAAAALVLSCMAPASAQQQQEPFPFAQLPLDVIGHKQVEGWRLTRVTTLFWLYEVASMSPIGEPEGLERNIRGYITGPRNRTQIWATADTQDRDNRQGCLAYQAVQYRPPGAERSEEWIENICLRGPEAADDSWSVAPFQIGVRRIFHTETASFQFLRLWNGTREELNAMLAQYGQSTNIPSNPSTRDLRAFEPVLRALAEPWAAETASSFEICDLSGEPCATLHASMLEGPLVTTFRQHTLPGSLAATVQVRGQRADPETWSIPAPTPEGASWRVQNMYALNYDYADPARAGRALYAMTEANRGYGGLFVVSAPPPLLQQSAPRLRAYLLKLARVIGPIPQDMGGQNGNPPSVPYPDMRIDLWPTP